MISFSAVHNWRGPQSVSGNTGPGFRERGVNINVDDRPGVDVTSELNDRVPK